jgi:hypothetical protein
MPAIPDFTDAEHQLIAVTLAERYGSAVELEPCEVELQLDASSPTLTTCPALYWAAGEAEFVVCKLAADRYATQFFYDTGEQFGTGRDEYANLGDCVVTVLQVQADEAARRSGKSPQPTPSGDDYSGPIVI